jgi:tRNA(Ser,Leu) C12 N-acetylase TAN1
MGTVEKGKFADLVLLEANPLLDIRNTQKIAAVIVDGHYLGRADLQKILDKVENTANQEPPKQKTGTVFQ